MPKERPPVVWIPRTEGESWELAIRNEIAKRLMFVREHKSIKEILGSFSDKVIADGITKSVNNSLIKQGLKPMSPAEIMRLTTEVMNKLLVSDGDQTQPVPQNMPINEQKAA